MQVLRQALLQSLPSQIIQFSVIRNKILCLTQNQLILLCIDSICKKTQIPYNGSSIYKIQMSKDYIALLQRTGRLQIRRVDNLGQVVMVDKNIKIVNNLYPRLKWWQDDLQLVYQKCYVTINVVGSSSSSSNSLDKQHPLNLATTQTLKQNQLLQLQFTDLFSNDVKSIFHIYKSQIILTVNNINIANIQMRIGQQIKQVVKLCHPFQQNDYNKQYLVVLVQHKSIVVAESDTNKFGENNNNVLSLKSSKKQQKQQKLKQKQNQQKQSLILRVYNILTLTMIFEKVIITTEQPTSINTNTNKITQIQLLTDQLSQYLLIKQYKKSSSTTKSLSLTKRQIQTQTLLKVNSEYYYSQQQTYQQHYQPFFMFEIQIGLKKDLKLFPSHVEQIAGRMCDSIDTCYFEGNQVRIVSIVLEVGYRNDIYYRVKDVDIVTQNVEGQQQIWSNDDDDNNKANQLVIWRQLVQAKVNPNKFIQKLINTSQLNKYNPNQKNTKNNNSNTQQKATSNIIGVQHQNILQSLLNKLHKINNFNLLNDKIDAYQTMKKILAIQYFPMLLDVMAIERDQNKKEKQILEKSNQDVTKTMSGCSSLSSRGHSPKSDNSNFGILGKNIKNNKENQTLLLKYDHSMQNQNQNYQNYDNQNNTANPQISITNNEKDSNDHCHHCSQIQDHQNLQLTSQILNSTTKHSDLALQQIQQSIYRMQTLTKYRLQKIQMKTRKQNKQSKKIVSFIENQFHQSLNNLHLTMMDSAKRFTQRILLKPQQSINKIKDRQEEFIEKVQEKRQVYDNSSQIHKENQQQLLDYLYDIEFPEVEIENQPKTSNMFDFFNISDLSKSLMSKSYGLDHTINEMNLSKDKTDEEFRMFSEFVLKNFI